MAEAGAVALISVAVFALVYEVTVTARNHVWGSNPTGAEEAKLTEARNVIWPNFNFEADASKPISSVKYAALYSRVKLHDTLEAWGVTQVYGQVAGNVIHLRRNALTLDKRQLASLLIHEAVHASQYVPSEARAYQAQSDALREWGLSANTFAEARQLFGAEPFTTKDDFLDDVISAFEEYHTRNPAWKRK